MATFLPVPMATLVPVAGLNKRRPLPQAKAAGKHDRPARKIGADRHR